MNADIKEQLNKFKDCRTIRLWSKEGVSYCVNHGIVLGNHNKLNLKEDITRAETAVMIMRMLQKSNLI